MPFSIELLIKDCTRLAEASQGFSLASQQENHYLNCTLLHLYLTRFVDAFSSPAGERNLTMIVIAYCIENYFIGKYRSGLFGILLISVLTTVEVLARIVLNLYNQIKYLMLSNFGRNFIVQNQTHLPYRVLVRWYPYMSIEEVHYDCSTSL